MAPQGAREAIAPGRSNGSATDPTLERLRGALLAAGAGDFSVRLPGRRKGAAGDVERAFNALVERNAQLTAELARMGRVIGRDGRMTERASLAGAEGHWGEALAAVNGLVDDLVRPTTEVARVIVAVADGDLSQKMALTIEGQPLKGEFARIGTTVNAMVDQLSAFSSEVTRVAREVGTDGQLGGQAKVPGVAGTWKDLTDNVNVMARNLTDQVRGIALVTTAVAQGDLSETITVEAKGEVAALADTINTMVTQLSAFAAEVTRVAREVGTEGQLGGQAEVPGVAGTWKDLTENVNVMASNLTDQVRGIAHVTTAVAEGDLSQKITVEAKGEVAALADTINTMVTQLSAFADEVTRVAREVGTEGKLGGQADVPGVAGTWKDLTENVNFMAANLTSQVRNIADVTTAVAQGDLSQKITVDVRGEVRELKDTINTMVDQLRAFADEVTRVAREVGTEGQLGGQAKVPGVAGTWKDLTENVNFMAENLTGQVRGIALVTTAVANGDLSQNITVDAKGEILELKSTINTMVHQLRSFADEVTRVAREVGTEGKLGGQAEVKGVSGTWKALTQNVNQLAANLTTQVRAIAEVSTAVTQGDLTRSITVEAQGEVAELSDNINQMIANLRETTRVNAEQDWLKTNLARIAGLLQGQRDLKQVTQLIMSEVTPVVSAQHGALFLAEQTGSGSEVELRPYAGYAYKPRAGSEGVFALGEGLVGQAAMEARPIRLTDVPRGYITVGSGLGEASAAAVLVMPIMFEEQVLGVLELAALRPFTEVNEAFLDQLAETLGIVINTIQANMRTEELLVQSQALTSELQKQSEELRQTNDELQDKAVLLSEQNRDIEVKNAEIELARAGVEEKASQLALSSKYKSEFLANMSHELRTPLNSLLILSRLLAENQEGNLEPAQVEFAETIHSAGHDLLALINDILDLSKVEAGKMEVNLAPVTLSDLRADVERAFRPVAEEKGLAFTIEVDPALPSTIVTDEQRLSQILRNLLSNAFKFTHSGTVALALRPTEQHPRQIAFSVTDTGIGIPDDKLGLIFEAFQQADGTTSRKYGGTGLGLSICREISRLLGGEIQAASQAGRSGSGSTFTLVLPLMITPPAAAGEPVALAPPAPAAEAAGEPFALLHDGVPDDRSLIVPGDRLLLIIGHDRERSRVALDAVRGAGAKGLVARRAPTGLALARELRPEAIVLHDPSSDVLLGQLKQHPETRHRPVYVAGSSSGRLAALRAGASGHFATRDGREAVELALADLDARAARGVRRLALVQDGTRLDPATLTLLGAGDDVDVVELTPAQALTALREAPAECTVLPLDGSAAWAIGLLEELGEDRELRDRPVIAYAVEPLSAEVRRRLDDLSARQNLVSATSPEALVDETALFLHRSEAKLPAPTRRLLEQRRTADAVFHGKRILIVDDDIRNVFALTSALEMRGMRVVYAENGREGIVRLREHADVELVLLDVMMPEMDGYETARTIRTMPRFETLPIISLTAKAMRGDRDKSLAAGASDYISKPVDMDQLLSLMRVWLHR
jgi:signal transduction histidine kinase/HAMP domain-containing protein/CheY-like chemotaxis protein